MLLASHINAALCVATFRSDRPAVGRVVVAGVSPCAMQFGRSFVSSANTNSAKNWQLRYETLKPE